MALHKKEGFLEKEFNNFLDFRDPSKSDQITEGISGQCLFWNSLNYLD